MALSPIASQAALRGRYRVPPPVAPPPQGTGLREACVLEENPSPYGVVLWRTLRSVQLWTETAPADRAGIFAEGAYESRLADVMGADVPAPVQGALTNLAGLLCPTRQSRPDAVASSCLTLASWARGEGKRATALAFLQVAAVCCPYNASLALMAGREARDQALYAQAESWLARAVAMARQVEDWDAYTRAHVAIGTMMISRGAMPVAKRHLLKAERRARRQGLRETRGMALHDLFVVSASAGSQQEALEYAREALTAYRAGMPALVNLAFDVAYFWMEQGYFQTSLTVFFQLLNRVQPDHRPHVQGAVARAAGACGRTVDHRRAAEALESLPVGPGSSEAWLDAARGAVSLARWSDARYLGERSLEIATERRERKVEHLAELILESIVQRSRPAAASPDLETEPAVEQLAVELVGTLERVPVCSAP